MVINSNYIHNNDVRIHFLESGIKTGLRQELCVNGKNHSVG